MVGVVTCDIIKSRRYSKTERQEVDKLIRQAFGETIELMPEAKADKLSFSIVQGDEFQFVINDPALAYRFAVFYRLILSLKPLKPIFRAGIGIGEIAVGNDNSYKMDGSAFHRSREVFQKFEKPKFRHRITGILSGNPELNEQFEIVAMYNDFLEQRWTDKHRMAIIYYQNTGSLEEAAKKESISYQAMQQRISRSGFQQFAKGLNFYTNELNARLKSCI